MTSIIDRASLFNGTTFSPTLQEAIYADILDTRCFFPDIFPYRYMYPDHAAVLLQGTVQIMINNDECSLPLSMAIPPNYPYAPPITQIAVQPGFPLITSECLQPNGLVLTQFFYNLYKNLFQKNYINFIASLRAFLNVIKSFLRKIMIKSG